MCHNYPWIEKIADVEFAFDPALFIKAQRHGHTIINYILSSKDTFPDLDCNSSKHEQDVALMRREFRGLIFDADGRVIRRPFHKFFNLGERVEFQNLNLNGHFVALEKLDGSMISPYRVFKDAPLIWGTKMGDTDVGKQAAQFVSTRPEYEEFANYCLAMGLTPMFEWCSRKQKIVVDYPTDKLVLTAVRGLYNGMYLPRHELEAMTYQAGIPLVKQYETKHEVESFIEEIKSKKYDNSEGIVLENVAGTHGFVKVKNEEYISMHHVKSELNMEHKAAGLILSGAIDDLLPLLDNEHRQSMQSYADNLFHNLGILKQEVYDIILELRRTNTERGDFARNWTKWTTKEQVKASIFKFYDTDLEYLEENLCDYLIAQLIGHASKRSKFMIAKDAYFSGNPHYKNLVYMELSDE